MSGFRVKFNVAHIPLDRVQAVKKLNMSRWHNKVYDAGKPIYWLKMMKDSGRGYDYHSTQHESGPILWRLFC